MRETIVIKDVRADFAAQMVADMGRKCRVLKRWRDPDQGDMARVETADSGTPEPQAEPEPATDDAPRQRGRPRTRKAQE